VVGWCFEIQTLKDICLDILGATLSFAPEFAQFVRVTFCPTLGVLAMPPWRAPLGVEVISLFARLPMDRPLVVEDVPEVTRGRVAIGFVGHVRANGSV